MTGTVLAFDFGLSTTGVAVGQTLTRNARGLATLRCRAGKPDWRDIKKMLADYEPTHLVVGLPLNMDGSECSTTQPARQFAAQLERKSGLPVSLIDERLTTRAAYEIMESADPQTRQRSDHEVAACLILEDWMRQSLDGN